jgi:glycosyltransferase involved in cell wall biosynthesis
LFNQEPQKLSEFTHNKLSEVLHINLFDNIGGAAIIANSLCRELINNKISSFILVKTKKFKDTYVAVISTKICFKDLLYKIFQINNRWFGFLNFSSLNLVNDPLFKQSDVLHLHNIHGDYFNYTILPQLTLLKPVIWTLHDTEELIFPCDNSDVCSKWHDKCLDCEYYGKKHFNEKSYFIWKLKKEIFRNSDFTIVCPSLWLKNKVENSIFKDHNVELIYNGIDSSVFFNKKEILKRRDYNLPDDKFILLFIAHGGLDNPSKGGWFFEEIYNRFKNDDNFFFISIGGDKTYLREKNWMEIEYIKDKIEMSNYYSLSDLFVYPSINDVFGLVVAESISCGTPVITFDTGGIPEIVDHMKTGYVAPCGDVDKLMEGIQIYYNDENLRNSAAIEGPTQMKNKFSINVMVDNYIKLYIKKVNEFNDK